MPPYTKNSRIESVLKKPWAIPYNKYSIQVLFTLEFTMARILIAEDDPSAQVVVSKFVEKLGHIPVVSPDGKHAYETLQATNDFDLLVTDVMMPKMDGRELIRIIRNNPVFEKLPVIIISAVIGINDISDLLEEGATFFLSKPLNREDFEEYVKRCIE